MTLAEVILSFVSWVAISLFLLLFLRKKQRPINKIHISIIILFGMIIANITSVLISQPGDRLLQSDQLTITDQPISIGFPLSYYEIGALGENRFFLLPFVINIAVVIILSTLVTFFLSYRSTEPML